MILKNISLNGQGSNIGNMARVKEYIICYCKQKENLKFNKLPLSEKAKNEYRYSDEKGKCTNGLWCVAG